MDAITGERVGRWQIMGSESVRLTGAVGENNMWKS